jgi:hypothetical protein
MNTIFKIFIALIFCFSIVNVEGQDSIKKSINITSSFKPVLKSVVKLGFIGTSPLPDSSKPRLVYNIPVQQIYPGLTPITIKPMAFNPDSLLRWPAANFIKLGYGNLKTPFISSAISLLAGKSNIIFSGNHIGSKGKLINQEYSQTSFDGFLNTPIAQNVMLDTKIELHQDKYYQYGYNHALFNLYNENDLLRQYYNISTSASIRNTKPTVYGLSYQPKIAFDFFRDNLKNNETNVQVDLPLEKFIGNTFGLKLGVKADINNYQPVGIKTIQNFIFTVPVGLLVRTPVFNIKMGMTPSWNNSDYKLLPDILIDFPVAEEKWIIQAGWISYYNTASYKQLSAINPFINIPQQLLNNRITERYLGFKGTLLNHFSYSTKIGYTEFVNMPLFVNDTISGKSFNVIFEEQLKAIQLHGEFGIIEAERFSMSAKFNWYMFNNLKTTQKAWGLVPMELSTHLRWRVMQSLWVTSDLFTKDGSLFRNKDGSSGRTPVAIDLNAGLELNITKKLLLWGQFNNILNTSYQRWNQYNNYGFNAVGGIIFKFNRN